MAGQNFINITITDNTDGGVIASNIESGKIGKIDSVLKKDKKSKLSVLNNFIKNFGAPGQAISSVTDTVDKIKNYNSDTINKNNTGISSGNSVNIAGGASLMAVKATQELINTGISAVSAEISLKQKVSGNTARSNAVNNKISAVSEIAGDVMNIAAYTSAGTMIGGPIGAAIGTVVGLTVTAIKRIEENAEEIAALKWEIKEQILEADQKGRRLGIIAADRGRSSASNTGYRL